SISNKFPYVPPGAGTTNINFAQFEPFGFNLSVIPKNFTTPRTTNYNLTLERELPGQTIVRIGYVGAHGSDLITSYTFNPTTPAGVQKCLADSACVASGGFNLPTQHPDYYQYPGDIWGNAGQQTNGGYSNYNSMQLTVEKHTTHGLTFQTSYTYSHSLDVSSSFEDTAFQAAGGVDPYGNFGRDYGSSAFDARHRWVGTFVYDIPGPKNLSNIIANRLLNGFAITGIATWQSGFPILLQDSNTLSLTCSGAYSFYGCPDRPDLVAPVTLLNPKTSTTHLWFTPSSFTDNAVGTLGNVGRGFLTGPTYSNMDFSVQKNTAITEGKNIQLRIEFYNLFNHTNFANPVGDVASSRFGEIRGIRSFTNSRLIQLGAKFVF
ncbi:MAG TPA: hypothetical protein VGF19_08275, partial [Candidatus Acidoferrum sp.]